MPRTSGDGGTDRDWLADVQLKVSLIRGVHLFAGLSHDDLRAISADLMIVRYRRGQLVTSPDDTDERLYIVKGGRVRLYRLAADGKQLTLDILDRGKAIGRMKWFGRNLRDVYAVAIEESLVCSYTPSELENLIGRYPIIGMNIIRYLSERISSAEQEIELMAYGSVEKRLAARLLELANRFGQSSESGRITIGARLTQQELADMVGATRETLAQAVSRLRKQAMIEMSNQRVVILDRDALERRAREATVGAPE